MENKGLTNKGYVTQRILSDNTLETLKGKINRQIGRVLRIEDRDTYDKLKNSGNLMADYHTYADAKKHGEVWRKQNRLLSEEDVRWFINTECISELLDSYDCQQISDEEMIGRPNIYWRLTRPNELSDVGPLHRDEWFWLLNDQFNVDMDKKKRIKVWIAVQCVAGLNGLLIWPGSQMNEDIEWSYRQTGTIKKPVLKTDIPTESVVLANTEDGFGVIFHDRLVHGGAVNKSDICRCSIEFTMIVPTATPRA